MRLEGISKAGYYPTPEPVVEALARWIAPVTSPGLRALDPCCGTGAALATLTRQPGLTSYGIEINEERAAQAREILTQVHCASAFEMAISSGAFHLLFLNPPYDADEEAGRMEQKFLQTTTRLLVPGGLLVFLIPQCRLELSARYLAGFYEQVGVYRFPDPHFARFHQIVLFARRRSGPSQPDPEVQRQLLAWSREPLRPLPTEPGEAGPYVLPPPLPGQRERSFRFASLVFDPQAAAWEAQNRGVWANRVFRERVWPAGERPIQPLMPLRKGHLALLIAAGFLNNLVLEKDGRQVIVKGRTYKQFVPVEEGTDEETEVEREILRTSVVLLDLATGDVITIE